MGTYKVRVDYEETGKTLYALIFNRSGKCYNGTTFTTFDASALTGYDVPLTEDSERTHHYEGSVTGDDVGAGAYDEEVWEQAGVNPIRASDTILGMQEHLWSGEADTHIYNPRLGLKPGDEEHVYNVTDGAGAPLADVLVVVTTDAAGTNTIASGTTDAYGNVTFWLDVGTYYMWRKKSGYNFTNPDTEVVS